MKLRLLLAALLSCAPAPAFAAHPLPPDPLESPMWTFHGDRIFEGAEVRFDPRVKVEIPQIAEDQHSFPVAIDARGIAGVKRMLILVDLNPIPTPLDYRLDNAEAFVATRIRLDQSTPVRGAVQLADGSWLVSGQWIDAAGGGCSAPPLSRVRGDWAEHLGEIRGLALPTTIAGTSRLRFTIRHPMDTGFVDNIPPYYIDTLTVSDSDGASLGTLHMEASLSEDPDITLLLHAKAGEMLRIAGRDTNGRDYGAQLAVARQTPLPTP